MKNGQLGEEPERDRTWGKLSGKGARVIGIGVASCATAYKIATFQGLEAHGNFPTVVSHKAHGLLSLLELCLLGMHDTAAAKAYAVNDNKNLLSQLFQCFCSGRCHYTV